MQVGLALQRAGECEVRARDPRKRQRQGTDAELEIEIGPRPPLHADPAGAGGDHQILDQRRAIIKGDRGGAGQRQTVAAALRREPGNLDPRALGRD
ncbi:hypothetical protein M2440_004005 [Methylorubrum extorquens]|nr:hypothetical protein [Methylorubrum extorquens]